MSLSLAALVALLVIAVLVLTWWVDPNTYKARIEAAVRDATGREFALVGDIELDVFPTLALRTGAGRFGNPPEFGPQPLATWRHLALSARLWPLIQGRLVTDRIVIDGADIRLARRADGRANWQGIGGPPDARPAPEAAPLEISIDGLDVRDTRLEFSDETSSRQLVVERLSLSTEGITPGKPYTDSVLSAVLHLPGFAPEGLSVALTVPRAIVPADLGRLDIPGFKLTLGPLQAEGAVQGSLGSAPSLTGRLASNVFAPRELLHAAGVAAPRTTDPSALGTLQFTADWQYLDGDTRVDLRTLQIDDTRFSGSVHHPAGDDAVGEFQIRGATINLARYLPPPEPDSEPFVLPAAALKQLRFRGSLELEQATLDDIQMKGVTLRLLLDEQGLRAEPRP